MKALYERAGGDASLGACRHGQGYAAGKCSLLPWQGAAPSPAPSSLACDARRRRRAGTSLETLWDASRAHLLLEVGGGAGAEARAQQLFDWHLANLEVGGLEGRPGLQGCPAAGWRGQRGAAGKEGCRVCRRIPAALPARAALPAPSLPTAAAWTACRCGTGTRTIPTK